MSLVPSVKRQSKVDLLTELMEINIFCQELKKTAFDDDHRSVEPNPWIAVHDTVFSNAVIGKISTLTRSLKIPFYYDRKKTTHQDESLAVIDALALTIKRL